MVEIVVKDKKDENVEKALDIVNAQQKIVGGALVGASGATLVEKSEESYEILEHIRQLSSRSLKSLKSIADSLVSMFRFDKDEARRARDQASELKKESQLDKLAQNDQGSADGGAGNKGGDGAGLGAMAFLGNFLGRLPGVGALKKLFRPILGFFGKSGVLFKLFGRFGPLAGLTLAVGFLIRYADDIAKALAPVLDGMKALYKALEPLLKAIMQVVDIFVKGALVSIGFSLKVAIGLVVASVEAFMNSLKFVAAVLKGLFTGDFGLIKDAFMEFISLDAFVKIFKKLGATIADAFKGLINGIGDIFGFDNLFGFVSEMFTNFIAGAKEKLLAFGNMLTSFVQGAFDFVMFIPRKIMEGLSFAAEAIGNFVMGLPDKIMSAVKGLFAPIMDFFSSIGITIKEAINGIIDALPMPQFLKDKIKFDIPVKEPDIKAEVEKETSGEVIDVMPKPKVKDGIIVDDNNEPILYKNFNMAKSAARLANIKDTDGDFEAKALKTGGFVVASASEDLKPNVDIAKKVRTSPNELGSTQTNVAPIMITRGGDSQTISNVAKTDYNNVALNVNVDNYHDRLSVAT